MAPTLVREPFHRDGWVYEEKVDGWRMLAYKDGAHVRLVSRHGVDHTRRFSDVATANREALGSYEDVVVGSELVFPVRRFAPNGFEACKQVLARGFEGYVAKDEARTYEGGATRRWLKVKQKNWTIGDERWTRRISVATPPSSALCRR
jgi:ATP-dependent DNA ligase